MQNKKKSVYLSSKDVLKSVKGTLIDPQAIELTNNIHWWNYRECNSSVKESYPIVLYGEGSPILMLHGFDSCFMEFRRLSPYLKDNHKLLIPDLFGFGFCPRPKNIDYGLEPIISHLNEIISKFSGDNPIGVIGASMGGAVAMELARRNPKRINKLLLLSPAGLTGKPSPVPPIIDQIGVWFLSQPKVRSAICKQAFSDPGKNVGKAEEQIASIHLGVPGWGRSLASFARKGGIADCGEPIPNQQLHVIWGKNDRILKGKQKKECLTLFGHQMEELEDCGHLPHIDCPEIVADRWKNKF